MAGLSAVDMNYFGLPEAEQGAPAFEIGIVDRLDPVLFGHIAQSVLAETDTESRSQGILKLVDTSARLLLAVAHFRTFPVKGEGFYGMREQSVIEQ